MEKSIFREKSIQRIESPESLNDYIRVSNPGVWLIISAVILLLIGACIWGIFGHIDTVVSAPVQVADGLLTVELNDAVSEQTVSVKIGSETCEIVDVSYTGSSCTVLARTTLPDGSYDADVMIESVTPFSLIFQ